MGAPVGFYGCYGCELILKKIKPKNNFINVSCGDDYMVALDIQGNIWTIASNYDNDLRPSEESLTKIELNKKFVQISCGSHHTLALD